MVLFNDLFVWLLLASVVIFLTIVILLRGIFQRFREPNEELKERVRKLERQVHELQNNK